MSRHQGECVRVGWRQTFRPQHHGEHAHTNTYTHAGTHTYKPILTHTHTINCTHTQTPACALKHIHLQTDIQAQTLRLDLFRSLNIYIYMIESLENPKWGWTFLCRWTYKGAECQARRFKAPSPARRLWGYANPEEVCYQGTFVYIRRKMVQSGNILKAISINYNARNCAFLEQLIPKTGKYI